MQSVLAFVSWVQLVAERVYSVVSEHRNNSCIHNTDTDPHIPPLEASSLLPSSLATVGRGVLTPYSPHANSRALSHKCPRPSGYFNPEESILKKTWKIIREWSNNWMYTRISTVPKDYHILVINKWKANTSKFPWQRLWGDITFTDSEGTCEQPAGSTEGTAETWNIFQACTWMWLNQSLMKLVPDEALILQHSAIKQGDRRFQNSQTRGE